MTKSEWEFFIREMMRASQGQKSDKSSNKRRNPSLIPKDTGNLKYGGLKGVWKDKNTFTIFVDERVAPYVFFTNERWENGRNPNEGWVDELVKYYANYMQKELEKKYK